MSGRKPTSGGRYRWVLPVLIGVAVVALVWVVVSTIAAGTFL